MEDDCLQQTLPRNATAQVVEIGGSDRGKDCRIGMDRQTGFGHASLGRYGPRLTRRSARHPEPSGGRREAGC